MAIAARSADIMALAVSLSGSGHLLTYQLGVLRVLLHEAPAPWRDSVQLLAGTSGGAIVAAAAATVLHRGDLVAFDEFVTAAARGDAFRAFSAKLTPGAARAATHRLFLGATECETGRAVTFGRYDNADELLACVLASAVIPRSAHPLDFIRLPGSSLLSSLLGGSRARLTWYPRREGVVVPVSCEWDIGEGRGGAPADNGVWGEEDFARAYVDGGLSSALPRLPLQQLLEAEGLGPVSVLSVCPLAGPRGRQGNLGLAGSAGHYHLCPADHSPRLPLALISIAGLRLYPSLANARAAQTAMLGGSERLLRGWFERGRADASDLVARGAPAEVLSHS
ncbi:acyl transferase/acyl hydrolase/lysophospholipase [Pavlovales sp. CCMP2436]|nr:acyl transferase/acyl hydrolase/lysophospholipase [Pavlovales sp. CCMP2436]|mmetsp:Transcript_27451/g.64412  ORF Transcript_27451/g.64412 Transcript_27451/m.64412 type:complete len:337 (+) Transcript_27451:83-1093(+)